MKIAICALIVCAALLPAMQCSAEEVALRLDGREWGLGYNAENESQGLREYVLKGETVNNWTELVTVQAFFGLQEKATPAAIMDGMVKRLKEICPDVIVKAVRRGDNDMVFEWEVKGCRGQDDQYEVDRVISGAKAVWHLHYATKKLPISPEKRGEWIRLLDSATLVNP